MKLYRDVLLIPKFNNMNIIEEIRKDCDELFRILEPHITIVFPFLDDITDEELISNIKNYFKDKDKFYVKFSGVSYSEDNYIFLNCIEGKEDIVKIHDDLYNKYFFEHLGKRKYVPHITIGQTFNCTKEQINKINSMKNEFECYIDTVMIEKIGINEESIVLETIKLN